jgi:hypothetical protein
MRAGRLFCIYWALASANVAVFLAIYLPWGHRTIWDVTGSAAIAIAVAGTLLNLHDVLRNGK